MKIILEIPKEYETEYKIDRFENSLDMLRHLIACNYEQEVANMLIDAFRNSEVVIDTPKINVVPAVPADNNYLKKPKKYIELTDADFEIGENLKRLIEKTMIELFEKYYAKEKNNGDCRK